MKKIVCVLGSPRQNGNSEAIARKFIETAESLGAQCETFNLYKLDFKGCIACMACKTGSEECVIKDGLKEVLAAVKDADILVMTSPIYFGQVTGELKCFIDRMYSFLTPNYVTDAANRSRLAKGKKCLFIATQGNPDGSFYDVFPSTYGKFFGPEWFGYECEVIRGIGLRDKTDAANNPDLMKQAEEAAKRMVG